MRRAKAWAGMVLLACLPGIALAQAAPCRQALALGLDVSGSVDAREYRLQLDGLVAALSAPSVRRALLSMPETPVYLMVYEWSGAGDQVLLADWAAMASLADIAVLQETLRQATRRTASPGTAIGEALTFGAAQLGRVSGCRKLTLDVSGDGKANLGPDPSVARDQLASRGITVNALVIGVDRSTIGDTGQTQIGELSSYYRAHVITGRDAFVQTALGYEQYGRAMARKLERELETLVVSGLQLDVQPAQDRLGGDQ